ncbi:hypothetical protein TNIN_495781 [Trichonephila inaurata madagascariensis]|uniref:Uncharacterized protein n=1 Tax=Trichonephila inaurata madagascariensis TaxID=2747483 RepID=A0A8X6XP77_9ARAC|nr:hypothetical protein TNIN_495781 [Trichonephila inaurata madagascariensis]
MSPNFPKDHKCVRIRKMCTISALKSPRQPWNDAWGLAGTTRVLPKNGDDFRFGLGREMNLGTPFPPSEGLSMGGKIRHHLPGS